MRVVLVPGTGSWRNDERRDWYCPGSPFVDRLAARGFTPVFGHGGKTPFVWDTDIGGIGLGRDDLVGWAAAGVALYSWIVPPLCPSQQIPSDDLVVIAHSHALQVALYACAHGLKIGRLVSMGSPVRKDMSAIASAARPNIARWLHVHSDHTDRWQWLGTLFDGHLGIIRQHPLADRNEFVPKVGHSQLLRNFEEFHWWDDRGWFDWMRADPPVRD